MKTFMGDSGLTWTDVLDAWHRLDVPEGWRPEVTFEGIVMTPPPTGAHNLIAETIHRALVSSIDSTLAIFQTLGVGIPSAGAVYIPDLCVVARTQVPSGSDPISGSAVLLAVEITSRSNADHDRKKKKWAYAHAGIAQYLLIDAFDEDGPSVSLFTKPVDGIYRQARKVAFGQSLALEGPLNTTLDSAQFPN